MEQFNGRSPIMIRLYFLLAVFLAGSLILITDIYIGIVTRETVLYKILIVIISSCAAFYIPPFMKWISNSGVRSKKKQELRFLKKIFVLCGNVKPVDTMQVISTMYGRSYYYKQQLEQIMDALRKSTIDKEDFFNELLLQSEDIDSKLFFEKLSIGFLYDFDMAIQNIEADFIQEKRAYARQLKKRIDLIHIVGVTGLFIAMTILMVYLLKPWLITMNFQIS